MTQLYSQDTKGNYIPVNLYRLVMYEVGTEETILDLYGTKDVLDNFLKCIEEKNLEPLDLCLYKNPTAYTTYKYFYDRVEFIDNMLKAVSVHTSGRVEFLPKHLKVLTNDSK